MPVGITALREYIKRNGLKLAGLLVAIILVLVMSSKALTGVSTGFTNMVSAFSVPIQTAATALSDWVESMYGYFYKYDSLVAENAELHIRLAEAEAEARAGEDASEENDRLHELLDYLEPHSDYVTQAAKITSWSSSNWSSTFTIAKGSNHGIELGDAVITEYGALVGIITELGDSWSTISTVIDVSTSIGALVGSDSAVGMVVGNYTLMQDGQVMLSYLAEGAQMFLGDTILTSGTGGNLPQGITIGEIVSVLTEAGGQIEYGVIEPTCDYSSLVQVFVITDFEVVE